MENFELEAMRVALESADKLLKDVEAARRMLESLYPSCKGESLFDLSRRATRDMGRLATHLRAALSVISTCDEAGDGDLVVECARRALDEVGV